MPRSSQIKPWLRKAGSSLASGEPKLKRIEQISLYPIQAIIRQLAKNILNSP
ncbi:MAG: hypothetical protein H6677_16670 [Candidatus Obscuribacterales bacterium]|nr:hypothetical protein [Candidatus Obscuribacterales bacterium]